MNWNRWSIDDLSFHAKEISILVPPLNRKLSKEKSIKKKGFVDTINDRMNLFKNGLKQRPERIIDSRSTALNDFLLSTYDDEFGEFPLRLFGQRMVPSSLENRMLYKVDDSNTWYSPTFVEEADPVHVQEMIVTDWILHDRIIHGLTRVKGRFGGYRYPGNRFAVDCARTVGYSESTSGLISAMYDMTDEETNLFIERKKNPGELNERIAKKLVERDESIFVNDIEEKVRQLKRFINSNDEIDHVKKYFTRFFRCPVLLTINSSSIVWPEGINRVSIIFSILALYRGFISKPT